MQLTSESTLSSVLWPSGEGIANSVGRALALVFGGVILISISAKLQIPFYPVPMTLQTLVLLVLGMAFGFKLATATALSYIALGAAGAPVFATGAGVAYLLGPTGGYLLGFVLAMALMGYMGDKGWGKTIKSMVLPMLLGTAIIFACGVAWLSSLIGLEKALAGGLHPFWFGAVAKIVASIFLMPLAWKMAGRSAD